MPLIISFQAIIVKLIVTSNVPRVLTSLCFVVVAQIAVPRSAERSVAYGHTGLDNGPGGHGPGPIAANRIGKSPHREYVLREVQGSSAN